MTRLLPFLIVGIWMLFINHIDAQDCIELTQVSALVPTWPVTWVPEGTLNFEFSVKMATADGVARLILASDNTLLPLAPYVVINLGWNMGKTAVGTTDSWAHMGICTTSDADCRMDTAAESSSVGGDVSANGYSNFVLSSTATHLQIRSDGSQALLATVAFDPQSIRYIGIESHSGASSGKEDHVSDWKFCTGDWQSLAANAMTIDQVPACAGACADEDIADGDRTSCYTTDSAMNPAINIDLGVEMHVVGVTFYNELKGEIDLSGGAGPSQPSDLSVAHMAANAVDGNTGPFSGCISTGSLANAWWMADMGSTKCVGRVVIWNRSHATSGTAATIVPRIIGAELKVGSDNTNGGGNNPACATVTQSQVDASLVIVLNCHASGQYLSVQLTDTDYLNFCEIKAYEGTCQDDIENAVVHVGSCTNNPVDENIRCGNPVTSDEAKEFESGPIYKSCPGNTYGRYVRITDTANANAQLKLCEVIVHGKPILEADKTRIEFGSAKYSTNEMPGAENAITHSQTLTLTRSGSAGAFTCSSLAITDLLSGSAVEGTTGDYSFNPNGWPKAKYFVDFATGETSVTVPVALALVQYRADFTYEEDKTIDLQLTDIQNGQLDGTQATTTITITDDDPRYFFSAPTASVLENDSSRKITLTVERSGFTSQEATIHVDTMLCGDTMATAGSDFISLSSKAITFPPNDVSETFDVYIIDDSGNDDVADETFCVVLDNTISMRGELIDPHMITVTIQNDDTVYEFCDVTYSGSEGANEINVDICRNGVTTNPGCIDVYSERTADVAADRIRATEGIDSDYPAFPRTPVMFATSDPSRKTIAIPINNDMVVEGTESFQLTLALPTACGSDVSPVVSSLRPLARLDIEDDDTAYSVMQRARSVLENAGNVVIEFQRAINSRVGKIMVLVSGGTDTSTNVGTITATEGLDFEMVGTHEVTFAIGDTTAELTIPIRDDFLIEMNEIFSVEIVSGDSEINQANKRTDVTIMNNDAYYAIQQTMRTVVESVGSIQVILQRGPLVLPNGVFIEPYLSNDASITLTTNSAPRQVSLASEGSDYTRVSKIITFSGATQESVMTCPIEITNDQVIEGEEEFFVTISSTEVQLDPARSQSTIKIADDDGRITCSVGGETAISVSEDQRALTVTCTRNGVDGTDGTDQSSNRVAEFVLTAISETASEGDDFSTYSSRLWFPVNVDTITETINLIVDDNNVEEAETLRLQITSSDSEIDNAGSFITVTILDNDVQAFKIEMSSYSVGESCGRLEVAVVRTGSGTTQQGTTLRITASNGVGDNGATYPDDYPTQEEIISFQGNQQRQVFTFDINEDDNDEGTETFTLTLSKVSGVGEVNPSAAVAVVTIQDQSVTYSAQDAQLVRDESTEVVPVYFVRSGNFCGADEIFVATRAGTARSGDDYLSFSSRLVSFGPTSTTASVNLILVDDNKSEQTETLTVEIVQNGNVQIGSGATTVYIEDNDGLVRFSQSEYSVVEGAGSVSLSIQADSSILPTTVEIQTVGDQGTAKPGSDYTAFTRFIDITNAETPITVDITDDDEVENEETFTVKIVSASSGSVSSPNEAIVTIDDNDDEAGSGMSLEAIVGIAAGAVGGVAIIAGIGFAVCVAVMKSGSGAAGSLATSAAGPSTAAARAYNGYQTNYGNSGYQGYNQGYGRSQTPAYYNGYR